jgi:hypothetical protein
MNGSRRAWTLIMASASILPTIQDKAELVPTGQSGRSLALPNRSDDAQVKAFLIQCR